MPLPLWQRTRSAAWALWVTVLFGVVWMALAYLVWLAIVSTEPTWLEVFYGGGDWAFFRSAGLWLFAAFKLLLWILVLAAVFLTFWSRRLAKSETPGS